MNVNNGATLTGGSSVTFSPAGITPGRSLFVGPLHTRLEAETAELFASSIAKTAKSEATGRTGLKLRITDPVETEGCCTTSVHEIVVDLGVRASMSAPEALLDRAIAHLRGFVYTTDFVNAVKKGILPQS